MAVSTGTLLMGIEAVRTWPMLKELDLDNDSDAWQYLDGLYVDELIIRALGQTDLECLRDAPYIERLYLRNAQVEDISALEGREDIVYLNLEQCVTGDLSPLFTMPNLATVEMSVKGQEQMEELIPIYGEPSFRLTYTY